MENLCCNKMSSFTNSSNSKLDSKLDSTKFETHHCWFDALALIMQTGYEVSSLSEPVLSHINDWACGSISDRLGV